MFAVMTLHTPGFKRPSDLADADSAAAAAAARLLSFALALISPISAADKAADHYWNPDDGWKIYESVGSLMYAIEEVDAPGLEVCGAHFQYETDSLRAKRMFPLP